MSASKRLPAVDGLRAVAALWVVAFHITAFSHARFPMVPGLDLFLSSGSTGVSLFLVLSGFCLFLPFAAGRTSRFRTSEFFKRRFRRLAPAYYVSLALSLGLILATTGPLATAPLSAVDIARQLIIHLTFTHSLFPDTFYAWNGAYWSLGLEWQLYLGLPLLVLGIRRLGLVRVLALVIVCSIVYTTGIAVAYDRGLIDPGYILPNQLFGRWAEFAFGMAAAELFASGRLARSARWIPLMIVGVVILVPISVLAGHVDLRHIVYGALFFALLCLAVTSDNVIARILSWRPLVALGTMSYSLYLVHQPIIQSVGRWFDRFNPEVGPYAAFGMMLVIVFPVILLLAWLLFITVERPTLGVNSATALAPVWLRRVLSSVTSSARRFPRRSPPSPAEIADPSASLLRSN